MWVFLLLILCIALVVGVNTKNTKLIASCSIALFVLTVIAAIGRDNFKKVCGWFKRWFNWSLSNKPEFAWWTIWGIRTAFFLLPLLFILFGIVRQKYIFEADLLVAFIVGIFSAGLTAGHVILAIRKVKGTG